jgi:hypothetical protein
MSYVANHYNYATPLSSTAGLTSGISGVVDKKYFTLSDNVLDGSYFPISGDVGLWGASVSGSDGTLPVPFIVTITESLTVRAFRLTGSTYNYPVDFTVDFYNGDELVYTITEIGNSNYEYLHSMQSNVDVTHYTVTITKISQSNAAARIYNVYNPAVMLRADTLLVSASSTSALSGNATFIHSDDTVHVVAMPRVSHVRNSFASRDDAKVASYDAGNLSNIHSVMKAPSRQVYGKVYITYTDPMLDSDTAIISDFTAYNSNIEQLLDGNTTPVSNLFTLYENDLTGRYVLSDESTQVGWTSSVLSNENGIFDVPPTLKISFAARPVVGLTIYFDDSHKCVPKDFTVKLTTVRGDVIVNEFVSNYSNSVVITEETITDAVSITLTITSATRAGYPVTVLEIPVTSTLLYHGYQDSSRLMSIDLLEELTYEDDIEALGGVSANEVTVVLDNSNKEFNFNNTDSAAASQLKRNRKIEPWLGAEVVPGEIEWYKLGTYWSYNWKVPVGSLTATAIGFDTIGLLDNTDYTNHHVQVGKSIGQLIEYVLEDAKKSLSFIEYIVDDDLYSIIIPYAWFEYGSHTSALRKISSCYPMHIYCDRDGRIVAAPQRLHLNYYYDTWSDSTNVINKEYSSLHTTLPNIVNVSVANPVIVNEENLANLDSALAVDGTETITLNFSKPYVSGIAVSVDCDSTVSYEYTAYSWGVEVAFRGSGQVRSISCSGECLDTGKVSVITKRDAYSVHVNGAVTRNIESDFIQTSVLANALIDRIFSLSTYDKYDAEVTYRGDIALTINDPILLLDGIAPDNRYNIKRHKLFWNGALSGSADLNT